MIVVAGEQVVDLVPAGAGLLRAALGGGPANTAIAAARLGAPVAMAARVGRDSFGSAFRQRLTSSGVDGQYLVATSQPSALALATVDDGGEAQYDFWLAGAADFGWRERELPELPDGSTIHIGSLAAFLPPGADTLERWALRHRDRCTITFDPNVRGVALARPDSLVRLERLVELAHLVRASEGDLTHAYPHVPPMETARRWLAAGPRLLVLTHGDAGAVALTATDEVTVAAPAITMIDTIGAGDTAMGALLAWLHNAGRLTDQLKRELPPETLRLMLRHMCDAAALTCTRPGADPPTLDELRAFQLL
ncbi:carbohydrate kinase [Catellatospora coxensis]|uniref:Fructokinase n=1 Tax=Catellatospora coxensis TaxID=310354 RepID=A0A8J3L1H0_9ACTN|nr:carbohydrate kinase [Catellatospora coxensis]GIG06876.1 fructokinase [Catellatospora coxensis]